LNDRTLERQIDNKIIQECLITTLSSFFGLLALLLAGVGLYGVLSYSVTCRTREIGVRMALGARRSAVLRLIARDAAILVVTGTAIGIPVSLAVTQLARSFLYGISPQDPATILLSSLILLATSSLAALVPALRAMKVDPMVFLRCE
jgi:ABC-type antimicrobial peptide transport system permease subunit